MAVGPPHVTKLLLPITTTLVSLQPIKEIHRILLLIGIIITFQGVVPLLVVRPLLHMLSEHHQVPTLASSGEQQQLLQPTDAHCVEKVQSGKLREGDQGKERDRGAWGGNGEIKALGDVQRGQGGEGAEGGEVEDLAATLDRAF